MPENDDIDYGRPLKSHEVDNYLAERNKLTAGGKTHLFEENENGKITINHIAAARAMIAFINNAPVDKWIKRVMIARLQPQLEGKPALTHRGVGLLLRISEDEVRMIELAGKDYLNEYMERVTGNLNTGEVQNKGQLADTLNLLNP